MLGGHFYLENDRVVVKRFFDAVAVFERIAKSCKSVSNIDPHGAYEEELEKRYKRTMSQMNKDNKTVSS
jgi:hypothetical protein